MAQTPNSDNQGTAPREMSMEIRLLLAFLLMGAVMFLSPYFFKSPPAPGKKTPTPASTVVQPKTETPAPAETAASSAATPPANAAEPVPAANATPQQPQPAVIIDTDNYRVVFNNQGATVRSWQLKTYKGNDGKPLQLVNTAAKLPYPFSLS